MSTVSIMRRAGAWIWGLMACACLVGMSLAGSPQSAAAAEIRTAHARLRLSAEANGYRPGQDMWAGVSIQPDQGWHVYWRNPGEVGQPVSVNWILPSGVTADELAWPAPERITVSGIVDYGYSRKITLLSRIHLASGLAGPQVLRAHVNMLICAKQCVPESADLELTLDPGDSSSSNGLAEALAALPIEIGLKGKVVLGPNKARIGIILPSSLLGGVSGAYLFPESPVDFGYAETQPIDAGPHGLTLDLPRLTGVPHKVFQTQAAVLRLSDGRSFKVQLDEGPLPDAAHGLGAPQGGGETSGQGGIAGMAVLVGLAFLGGLILNLMPCVFPILSVKILALSRAGHDHKAALSETWLYGLGVVLSFLGLAAILLGARAAGQAVGWGFQLQSPWVTAGLALVMLLVGLNLAGLFEVGQSLQGLGGVALSRQRPGLMGLMTGVLAVVVAAPCTAPFMATAIGAALAQGGSAAWLIFLALGLGFAAPIIGLSHLIIAVPGLAAYLPRPGAWMVRLRQILAVPMFLAALWLVWVFWRQTGLAGLGCLVVALILIAGVLSLKSIPDWARLGLSLAGLALIPVAAVQKSTELPLSTTNLATGHAFSLSTLQKIRAAGQPVLVDMTAAWCLTCKVNERLVLYTPDFQASLKRTHTTYMVGDWTHQDAEITRYLSLNGRSGVPLYVYYPAHQGAPVILPQILDKASLTRTIETGSWGFQ